MYLCSGAGGSQYGSFPALLLDPLIERVRELVAQKQDLQGLGRSLANAYTLYLKSRPPASAESSKRAKGLATEGPHPLLLVKMQQEGKGLVDLQVWTAAAAANGRL